MIRPLLRRYEKLKTNSMVVLPHETIEEAEEKEEFVGGKYNVERKETYDKFMISILKQRELLKIVKKEKNSKNNILHFIFKISKGRYGKERKTINCKGILEKYFLTFF